MPIPKLHILILSCPSSHISYCLLPGMAITPQLHCAPPPRPTFAVLSAHNTLAIVLYLWRLSFKVCGSAHRTPRPEVCYNHTLIHTPFFCLHHSFSTSWIQYQQHSAMPDVNFLHILSLQLGRTLSHSFHLSSVSGVPVPATILDNNDTKSAFSLSTSSVQ